MNGKKVLVIDDDEDLLDIYSELLRMKNYSVSTKTDGIEGIKRLRNDTKKEIGAIITDCCMPILNGIEFIEVARMENYTQPILIHSHGGFDDSLFDILKQYKSVYCSAKERDFNYLYKFLEKHLK